MTQSVAIERFLNRLNPELAETFSNEQLDAVELHFGMRYKAKHMIDWRTRFRFPFLKLYLVVLAGKERRNNVR